MGNVIQLYGNEPKIDDSPADLLFESIKKKEKEAEIIIHKVFSEVSKLAPELAQLKEATKKGFRLVVDASDEILKDIESGKIKLSVEKNGKVFAQIRNANGRYGAKLPIKKEVFAKGIDPVQMANAMQMAAIQDQLKTIEEQIQFIDESVQDVLQGQQNDRIGLYYSGYALYLEAQNVSDKSLRSVLIGQALRSLSDAAFQLGLKMQSDIDYLAAGEYKKAKGKGVKLIDSHMDSINQSFGFIHQAFLLKAGIYCNEGELSSMNAVLKEYSRFINETIKNNVDLLSQCDKNDDGTDQGVWNSRKNLYLDTSRLNDTLTGEETVLYLDWVKEG